MYDLIDSFTFKLRAISPSLWPTFEMTYRLFKSDAIDFLEGEFWFLAMMIYDLTLFSFFLSLEMLPSLDNFLSYGSDVIKSTPDYKRMLVDIYQTAITAEHLGENDKVNGSKLAESVLLNLRGHVDEVCSPNSVLQHLDFTHSFLSVPADDRQYRPWAPRPNLHLCSASGEPRSPDQCRPVQSFCGPASHGGFTSGCGPNLFRSLVRRDQR